VNAISRPADHDGATMARIVTTIELPSTTDSISSRPEARPLPAAAGAGRARLGGIGREGAAPGGLLPAARRDQRPGVVGGSLMAALR